MIRFTVTWLLGARNQLADLWTAGPDRQAIADAADQIDRELAVDAHLKGTPISEGLRGLHVPPLFALYTVSEPDRIAEVVSVRSDWWPLNPFHNGQSSPNAGSS